MEKLNLQRFADEADNAPANEQGKPAEGPKGEAAKYTDADLDKIISAKFAKWAADRDKAVDDARKEGEKLAKMNADQKRAYELEQAQKEAQSLKEQVAKLEQAQKQAELRKSAAEIFSKDYKLTVSNDVLDFVVGKDAEDTNANIQKMAALLQAERQAGEKARATGSTPFGTSINHEPVSPFQKKLDKWK
ncbi:MULTISPECIES: DUF4355 domain-containing protein [Allobaculum]|uniref:DUF4355 domain-containing protein n=1 Tax=Allobaculum TaxID=174708 RepID=UPI001E45F936|nr:MULTISPECIES: DUF4355 domain-containing protein [Allobaculum]UNT92613.1 DUF4355 domain-containing protein [Allobaculum sp. Allo2]